MTSIVIQTAQKDLTYDKKFVANLSKAFMKATTQAGQYSFETIFPDEGDYSKIHEFRGLDQKTVEQICHGTKTKIISINGVPVAAP